MLCASCEFDIFVTPVLFKLSYQSWRKEKAKKKKKTQLPFVKQQRVFCIVKALCAWEKMEKCIDFF